MGSFIQNGKKGKPRKVETHTHSWRHPVGQETAASPWQLGGPGGQGYSHLLIAGVIFRAGEFTDLADEDHLAALKKNPNLSPSQSKCRGQVLTLGTSTFGNSFSRHHLGDLPIFAVASTAVHRAWRHRVRALPVRLTPVSHPTG